MAKMTPYEFRFFTSRCDAREAVAKAVYLCDADRYSQSMLWREYSKEAEHLGDMGTRLKVDFTFSSGGCSEVIGSLDKRPLTIEISMALIEGRVVCFIDSGAQLVDWKRIEEWLLEHAPHLLPKEGFHLRTDATNFVHAIHHIFDLNRAEAAKAAEAQLAGTEAA